MNTLLLQYIRLLSRLLLDVNVSKSLEYSELAISLGDTPSKEIQAHILNSDLAVSSKAITPGKLSVACELIALLDPLFTRKYMLEGRVRDSGFVTFLLGEYNIVQTSYQY